MYIILCCWFKSLIKIETNRIDYYLNQFEFNRYDTLNRTFISYFIATMLTIIEDLKLIVRVKEKEREI